MHSMSGKGTPPVLTTPSEDRPLKFFYINPHVATCSLVRPYQCRKCSSPTYLVPFCSGCLVECAQLEVRQSNIREAGLGLFAARGKEGSKTGGEVRKPVFDVGQVICDYGYVANLISEAEVTTRYGSTSTQPYTYRTEDGRNYDSALFRTVGCFANDASGGGSSKAKSQYKNNAVFSETDEGVSVTATRPIFPGDEIFIPYGSSYWSEVGTCRYATCFDEPEWFTSVLLSL